MHQIDFGELLMIKITREKFLEKVIKLHGLKYDYTFVDYVNNTTKIKIICQIHGMFLQRPVNHLKGKGCDKCGGTSDLTVEKFKEKCIKIHNKKYDYLLTEYKSYNSKIIIICPDHGIFFQTPRNHLQGRGCPKCGKTNVISTQEFIEKASKVHKEKYDYCLSNYINAKTKVKGGSIELKDGKLTGILIDNAMDLVDKKIPIISDSLAKKYYKVIEKKCFSFGLTQVHDCGVSEQTIELIDQEQKDGKLKIKIFALLQDDPSYYEKWLKKGVYKTERLTVGGFKLYADGALGSRGACLLKSYTDMPNWKGFLLNDSDRMYEIAQKLYKSNFQLCTHAIGDSANRQILKIYASTLKTKNNKRWRIEHAQVLNKSDLNYFNKYSIIPSVQPTHATSDMYWAKNRLGEKRIKEAYAYNDLLKAAGYIALGTDFPVEDISPFKTFYAAVARQDSNGFPTEGFQKENALSRKNALKGMTIWAAYANFAETKIGSLEKGKMADFIILDTDLLSCDLNKIIKTKVLATYINGEKVY